LKHWIQGHNYSLAIVNRQRDHFNFKYLIK
jgi:hypothetical protein